MTEESDQILPGDKAGPANFPGANKEDQVPAVRSADPIRPVKEESETLEGQKATEAKRLASPM